MQKLMGAMSDDVARSFAERGGLAQSRAARSWDSAIHVAWELLSPSCDVRRIIEPNGSFIERPELDEHFDGGRFPGMLLPLMAKHQPSRERKFLGVTW